MVVVAIGMIVLFVVFIFVLLIARTYNNFQNYVIRINEAEVNIDSVLRKRFDLLSKSIDIIKANINTNEEVLGEIVKLRSRKVSNFDLDRCLYDGIAEFNTYQEKYPKLKKSEIFMKNSILLNESEAEIIALKKYYNDIITNYNKLVKSFPSNIVALLFRFKSKLYFDGKDMSDNDIKDFKL